jgi:hypothetical protein
MTVLRSMWTGLVLGSAMLVSRNAVAQSGSSVSLTHMVTVTVPPRVKVQISSAAPVVQNAVTGSSVQATTNGIAVSVRATESWTLSISSNNKTPKKWSHDQTSGFAPIGSDSVVASGTNSQAPTAATVYFRNDAASDSSNRSRTEGSDAVTLTVAAR